MNKKIKFPALTNKAVYILLACSGIFTVLQSVMLLVYYETDVHLYAYGTAMPTVFNLLLFFFIGGTILFCSFASCDRYSDELAKSSVFTGLFAGLTSASLFIAGILGYISYNESKDAVIPGFNQNAAEAAAKQERFILWSFILAFIAFAYYIACAVNRKADKVNVILGCVTIVWHIMYLLSVYFDMHTSPLNDPIRLMNEFATVAMIMYLTAEIRFLCKIPKKGLYIGISVSAFTLLLTSSVSNIIYALSGSISLDLIYIYQLFGAGYIAVRLLSQLNVKE